MDRIGQFFSVKKKYKLSSSRSVLRGAAGAVRGLPLPQQRAVPAGRRHLPLLLRPRLPRQALPVQVQRMPTAPR